MHPTTGRTWRAIPALAVLCLTAVNVAALTFPATVDFPTWLDTRWETSFFQIQQEMSRYPKVAPGGDMRRIWTSDAGPVDVVIRRTQALLDELKVMPTAPSMTAYESQLATYRSQASGNASNLSLFKQVCSLRRQVAMSNPLLDFEDIIFTGFGSWQDMFHSAHQGLYAKADAGAGLYRVSGFKGTEPVVTDMLEHAVVQNGRYAGKILSNQNPEWGGKATFQTPELSFDSTEIMFAWCENTPNVKYPSGLVTFNLEHMFRIFAMDLDGSNLRPLADHTTSYNDYDPTYLPNGRILFVSDRHNGGQRCGSVAVSGNMYTMKPDGSDLIRITWHETNERCPTLTNDGQIVYSRWDYIDRHAYSSQCMWLVNPDGSNPRAWHGMYMEDDKPFHPISETDVMPIPGTYGKFVAIEAGHHDSYYGNLVVIDINKRARYEEQIRWFWPGWRLKGDQGWVGEAERYKKSMRDLTTPVPLSEDYVIACEYSEILLLDKFRNEVLLFDAEPLFVEKQAGFGAVSPIPVKTRPVPPTIETVTYQGERRAGAPKAVISVMNVYETDTPFPQGTRITHLRICQLLGKPKLPWNGKRNIWQGWSDGALLKAVLGTVPVEEDGSVYFEAPIEREIFFQAVDSTGMAVTSMLSGTYVHPGEHLTCIGCHEDKWTAAEPGYTPRALQRAPSKITPDVDGSCPLTYARLAKPVFEDNCVSCHAKNANAPSFEYWDTTRTCNNGEGRDGPAVGELEKYITYYNAAYENAYCAKSGSAALYLGKPGVARSRSIPYEIGARASPDFLAHLGPSHHDVQLTQEEFHRVTLWLDLNAQELGSYSMEADDIARQRAGEVVWPEWPGGSGLDPLNPTGVQPDGEVVAAHPRYQVHEAMQQPRIRPVAGRVHVTNLPSGRTEVLVLGLSGRVIARDILDGPGGGSAVIELSPHAAGTYVVSVRGRGSSYQRTLALPGGAR